MSSQQVVVEADTVEHAIRRGLRRLGTGQSRADIEILDDGGDGILDAEQTPARVRIRAEGVDLLEKMGRILREVLDRMGLEDFRLEVEVDDEFYRATIHGDRRFRFLIGRYGETLNALQQYLEEVLNRHSEQPVDVVVDADGYRDRRRDDLRQRACEISAQVRKTGEEIRLEPMIPVERKIVHETVADIPDVKSHSIGEDTNRRVVILPRGRS